MKSLNLLIIFVLASIILSAQSIPGSYLNKNWKQVATQMPDEWYGTDEAKLVAENVLLCQKEIGGWEKNKPWHKLSDADKTQFVRNKAAIGATFDNSATTTEMMFLARVYQKTRDERYKASFLKALEYIFKAQYENGGWPQFFPFRDGKSVSYASHITFNDNAMVNVMNLLNDIVFQLPLFEPFQMNGELRAKAKKSFDKGVECILKTQIKVDGKLTVWCAQHDEFTFAPANARAYELASFSGSESVGITLLLMKIDNPTREIIDAVNGAVRWFEENKVKGIKLIEYTNSEGLKDTKVEEDPTAPPLWARFYDLNTGKPFFCDRDGIKRNTFGEIGYNRRNGYGWYTDNPGNLLQKFPKWAEKWNK